MVNSERATCVYRGGVSAEEEGSNENEKEKEISSTFHTIQVPNNASFWSSCSY